MTIGPYTAAPSRVLPGLFCVYDRDGTVVRNRTRIAKFATQADAEAFVAQLNRRRPRRCLNSGAA